MRTRWPRLNDNLPRTELADDAGRTDRIATSIRIAQQAVTAQVGYPVEIEIMEPIKVGGRAVLRIGWRRKPPVLRLVH